MRTFRVKIGDYATINSAAGNQTNNHTHHHPPPEREDRVKLGGLTFRHVIEGDIKFLRNLSSEVIDASADPQSSTGTLQVVKLQRTDRAAEAFGSPGQVFTVTTFRATKESDANEFEKKIKGRISQMVSLYRESPFVTQLFGTGESDGLRLLTYDELANGHDILLQYYQERPLVWRYLAHTKVVRDQRMWKYNLSSSTWQYDPSSFSIPNPSPWYSDAEAPDLATESPLPVLEGRIQLVESQILGRLEEMYGDLIRYMASYDVIVVDVDNKLPGLARDGYLTLGTVVDFDKPRILSHFRSIPSPSMNYHYRRCNDVKITHWGSDGRCDLSFSERSGNVLVDIRFTLEFPHDKQLRAAYLSQCLRHDSDCESGQLAFIARLGFALVGEFFHDPMAHPISAYLFVPPLQAVKINNMYCVPYPLPEPLFFWTVDPEGQNIIEEKDWEEYNIPKLRTVPFFGSSYRLNVLARGYLHSKGYEPDGRRYCRDHNLPELIPGDPHDMDLFGSQKPDMSFWDATDKNWTALRVSRVGSTPNQVVVVDFMKARNEAWSVNTRRRDKNSWKHTEFIDPDGENFSILRLFMLGRVKMICKARTVAANLHDNQSEQHREHDQGTSDPADDWRHHMTLTISEAGNGSSQGIRIRFEPVNLRETWSWYKHWKAGLKVFTEGNVTMQIKFGLSEKAEDDEHRSSQAQRDQNSRLSADNLRQDVVGNNRFQELSDNQVMHEANDPELMEGEKIHHSTTYNLLMFPSVDRDESRHINPSERSTEELGDDTIHERRTKPRLQRLQYKIKMRERSRQRMKRTKVATGAQTKNSRARRRRQNDPSLAVDSEQDGGEMDVN
ncbi:hypothetical protein PM082_022789 [Marasmius tenuissimus]|nr:hypothetical protein PM082_022789 [Marasmius tenuissimus]